MNREKIIAKLEKEVKRTYAIKTTTVLNGTKVSEEITVNREPSVRIPIEMADKILALLKEQEAVEPITQSSVYDPDTWFYVCGSCKKSVIDRGDKFCRWCGKPVLWEGR